MTEIADREQARLTAQLNSTTRQASEANQQAAAANEKAERLRRKNLELEAKVAPRRLTGGQKSDLSKLLAVETGRVGVISYFFDSESADFADDLADAIHTAQWQTVRVRNFIGD